MPEKWRCNDHSLNGLPAPVKNRFFYGMLLTDEVLRKDQHYFDGKRWLLNRLAVGKGVLAGLDFEVHPATKDVKHGYVRLSPGVAMDGYGREIVVSKTEGKREVEIRVDDEARYGAVKDTAEFLAALKVTKPEETATLALQIAYRCEPTDPAPVKAGHCGHDCEPSSDREQFRVRVIRLPEDPRRKFPGQPDDQLSSAFSDELTRRDAKWSKSGNLADVFPPEPGEEVRHRGKAQENSSLALTVIPEAKDDDDQNDPTWVTLGILELTSPKAGDKSPPAFAKKGRYYRQLFSNDSLSRLVFGLADRVDEATRARIITFDGTNADSGEGQTQKVYQPLSKPLKVKVVDSTFDANAVNFKLKDHPSAKVRFEVQSSDGGMLSTDGFDATVPYVEDAAKRTVEVQVKADGTLDKEVHWRLSKTPGLHTVSARIIPATPADPPFHAGSQLTFHATAAPTAPTIVGMYLYDWHTPIKDKCIKWKNGCAKLRIVFSRKMKDGDLKSPRDWLRVWRVFSGTCDPLRIDEVKGPELVDATFARYESIGNTQDALGAWYADYTLTSLLHDLHDHFVLRMLVAVRPTPNLKSVLIPTPDPLDPSGTIYPNEQQLDVDLPGSFLVAADRKELWDNNGLVGKPTAEQVWERFQLREQGWPSGNGEEGGSFPNEFHKTFEFSLPRGC